MDDDARIAHLEELLKETLEVVEENNKILHSIQRTARWSFWGRLALYAIFIVLPLIVLAPLLHSIIPATNTTGSGLFGLPSAQQFQDVLKAYQQ